LKDGPEGAPRVSVILRTKDRPRLLAEALESLRAQTTSDFETLVVNDGGTIDPALLSPTPGRSIRVVAPPPPGGRTRALNAGLAAAAGRYVAYLDDDDLYQAGHLALLAGFLDGTDEYGAAYSSVEQVAQSLGADGRYHDAGTRFVFGHAFDRDRILFKNDVPLIALMHRRELGERAGGFDEAFDHFEDWDFLIRLSRLTRLHHLSAVTAVYRVRDDGSNATTGAPWLGERAQAARRQLFAKHAGLRGPESEMGVIDSLDRDLWDARGEIRRLGDTLGAKDREAAGLLERVARLEEELRSLRADLARTGQSSGERESALAKQAADLARQLDAVHRSLWWRLATPWWKLKRLWDR
jgi:glycosyltransferase involved in cell wall biosynthesis